jgi:hypothetical protein
MMHTLELEDKDLKAAIVTIFMATEHRNCQQKEGKRHSKHKVLGLKRHNV